MSQKVIIIGAGIAGLTAGTYARRAGLDATILEMHTIPGGMCTSWRRKGYLFEGGTHWMTGSSPKTALNRIWREVGALNDDVNILYSDCHGSVEIDGKVYYLYRDPNKMQKHFDEISPEDAEATRRLVADVRAFQGMGMPITDEKGVKVANPSKMSIGDMMKMMPLMPKMMKYSKMSMGEFTSQWKHPAIRQLLTVTPDDFSAIAVLATLGTFAAGDGGYPEGGSLGTAQRMADTFTGLGGKILYKARAERVIVENGKVVGVRVHGEILPADAVIVTQETIAAAEQLFEAPPRDEWLVKLKQETKHVACCFVSIGVKADLRETPTFFLAEPIRCGGIAYDSLGFNNYADFPGYAPEGCTALTTFLGGDTYDYWKKAREEGRYEEEKQKVGEQVVRALCEHFPEAEGKVEVVDVATPLTYERYTGAAHGSWMTVMGKGENNIAPTPCTLEGIRGVYFAGHRVMKPGGQPAALATGRRAAQLVCKQFDVMFK